jgi:hypothetical protein
MKKLVVMLFCIFIALPAVAGEYLGQLSRNPYTPNSTSGPGAQNHRINQALNNQYGTGGPKAYDSDHNFRGNLNGNRYHADSISNPYGRYGSRYSSESINNPYGAGSKYRSDSPNNPYGTGWSVYDD